MCKSYGYLYIKGKYIIYSYEVYNKATNDEDDSRRTSSAGHFNDESSATNNETSQAHEMAKTWYTLVDEAERSRISGVTTHRWIEDKSVALTHQLLIPCNSDLQTISRNDVIIESRERKLKVTSPFAD